MIDEHHEWHGKIARDLMSRRAPGAAPAARAGDRFVDGPTSLEIGLGRARSAVAYVLEMARAHRIPATGSLAGDDVWMQLGDTRVRFTLNRREGHVVVTRPGRGETRVRWDEAARALADGDGALADLGAIARDAIEVVVADWRASPAHQGAASPPNELDDEPTKG
jgi:hypothetical protein